MTIIPTAWTEQLLPTTSPALYWETLKVVNACPGCKDLHDDHLPRFNALDDVELSVVRDQLGDPVLFDSWKRILIVLENVNGGGVLRCCPIIKHVVLQLLRWYEDEACVFQTTQSMIKASRAQLDRPKATVQSKDVFFAVSPSQAIAMHDMYMALVRTHLKASSPLTTRDEPWEMLGILWDAWSRTVFSNVIPEGLLGRLYDMWIHHGVKVLCDLGIILMTLFEPQLEVWLTADAEHTSMCEEESKGDDHPRWHHGRGELFPHSALHDDADSNAAYRMGDAKQSHGIGLFTATKESSSTLTKTRKKLAFLDLPFQRKRSDSVQSHSSTTSSIMLGDFLEGDDKSALSRVAWINRTLQSVLAVPSSTVLDDVFACLSKHYRMNISSGLFQATCASSVQANHGNSNNGSSCAPPYASQTSIIDSKSIPLPTSASPERVRKAVSGFIKQPFSTILRKSSKDAPGRFEGGWQAREPNNEHKQQWVSAADNLANIQPQNQLIGKEQPCHLAVLDNNANTQQKKMDNLNQCVIARHKLMNLKKTFKVNKRRFKQGMVVQTDHGPTSSSSCQAKSPVHKALSLDAEIRPHFNNLSVSNILKCVDDTTQLVAYLPPPMRIRACQWQVGYNTEVHGRSLEALYNHCCRSDIRASIILVKELLPEGQEPSIFGAFHPGPLVLNSHRRDNRAEASGFLFRLSPKGHRAVYRSRWFDDDGQAQGCGSGRVEQGHEGSRVERGKNEGRGKDDQNYNERQTRYVVPDAHVPPPEIAQRKRLDVNNNSNLHGGRDNNSRLTRRGDASKGPGRNNADAQPRTTGRTSRLRSFPSRSKLKDTDLALRSTVIMKLDCLWFGGADSPAGLWIGPDIVDGTTARSTAYGNDLLCVDRSGDEWCKFEIENLEVVVLK